MSLQIRPLQRTDIPAAAATSAAAFEVDISSEANRRRWEDRLAHPLATDPGGSFVAERDGRLIGVAQAVQRERLWCLSLLAVQPGVQSAGAGRALMRSALAYGNPDHGLIVGSNDPRALRLYAQAGFSLHPTFEAHGTVDRSKLPRPSPSVKTGDERDLDALAAISREVRGAPHTTELVFALSRGAQLLRVRDRGFAVADAGQGVWLLAARDAQTATDLLWSTLELAPEPRRPAVRWMTGGQDWAIDVVIRAGLNLRAYGALCVRGRPGTLHPFVPSGPFA